MVFTLLGVAVGTGSATVFCIEVSRALSSIKRKARHARAQAQHNPQSESRLANARFAVPLR